MIEYCIIVPLKRSVNRLLIDIINLANYIQNTNLSKFEYQNILLLTLQLQLDYVIMCINSFCFDPLLISKCLLSFLPKCLQVHAVFRKVKIYLFKCATNTV